MSVGLAGGRGAWPCINCGLSSGLWVGLGDYIPGMSSPVTSLDLESIVARGWALAEDFAPAELARASRLWCHVRSMDTALAGVRDRAGHTVHLLVKSEWSDFGSHGLRLNLPGSDIDLGVGVKRDEWSRVQASLSKNANFLGIERTPFASTRMVFQWWIGESLVDLSVVTPEAYRDARNMISAIDAGMTQEDRIRFTWIKHQLKTSGNREEYAAWKLAPYRRFCPGYTRRVR